MIHRIALALAGAALLIGASEPGPGLIYLDADQPKALSLRGIELNYDGRDTLRVQRGHLNFRISAMTPAIVGVSPDRRYLIQNFGNGSGQVYDLRAYSLVDGRAVAVDRFKQRVLAFARSRQACRARMNQISFGVEGWRSAHSLRIGTEDWTRRPGCGHIYRKWTFELP